MLSCSIVWLATLVLGGEAPAVEVSGAVIKAVEEAEVPASEAGALAKVPVKEGQLVEEDDVIAQILDTDVKLTIQRAKLEAEIAGKKAANDISVKFAKKSTEIAKAELRRSLETNEKFPKTVSDTELDRLRLTVQKGELETQQAEHDLEVASLTRDVKETEQLTAQEQLRRRTIRAPFKGMVVDVHRRRGEWVQPGEAVARLVRMDRLRVEGFLAAKLARQELVGSKVKVKIAGADGKEDEFPGAVVFVSPEIDPLNAQVRIWAEVENHNLKLRPGLQATFTIEPR